MNALQVVTLIKDVCLAIAALAGVYVGLRGLGLWRRQLVGNADYQLARTILTNLIEVRDAVQAARNNLSFLSYEKSDDADGVTREESEWRAYRRVVQGRWDPIQISSTKLYASGREAEAAWSDEGQSIRAKLHELRGILTELWWAMTEDVDAKNPANRHQARESVDPESRQEMLDRRRILYARKDDEFKVRLDKLVDAIDGDLRPFITGKYRR